MCCHQVWNSARVSPPLRLGNGLRSGAKVGGAALCEVMVQEACDPPDVSCQCRFNIADTMSTSDVTVSGGNSATEPVDWVKPSTRELKQVSFPAMNEAKVHLPLVSDLCPDLLPNRQGLRLFQLLCSVSGRRLQQSTRPHSPESTTCLRTLNQGVVKVSFVRAHECDKAASRT